MTRKFQKALERERKMRERIDRCEAQQQRLLERYWLLYARNRSTCGAQ